MPNGTCCACASAKPAEPPSLHWAPRRPCCGGSVEAWRCCGASQNWRTTWSGKKEIWGGFGKEKKAFLKGVGDRNFL